MTLPSHEYRDKFCGTRRRALPLFASGTAVARGAAAGFTEWLRRRALAQYSRFVFSVLDGLRAGGYCDGSRSARSFQGLGAARGTTRPLCRHDSDCVCRHLHDVVDLAILKKCP